MKKSKFKDSFIKYLLGVVPENVNKEYNFEITENKSGFIRLDEGVLMSVYLICRPKRDAKKEGEIFVKFKYRDFHYRKPDFIFDKIYYRPDSYNEYRYDKDLEMDAVYIRWLSILPELDLLTKEHYLNVFKEWQEIRPILLENNEYIPFYQVIKDKERVKTPYIICSDKFGKKSESIANRFIKVIDSITSNFDIKNCVYGCKAIYKDDKIIKLDILYLLVNDSQAKNIIKGLKKINSLKKSSDSKK